MTDVATARESPGAHPGQLELDAWQTRYGVVAGVTTRAEGNLGLLTDAPAMEVTARWRAFLARWNEQFTSVVGGLQVHRTAVAEHGPATPGWLIRDGVDGHLTRSPGILLTVTIADCVPIYLIHPGTGTIALLHAGWRGVAAGMLEAGVRAVQSASGAPANEIVIHCGVGICGSCYEVGSDVIQAVTGMDFVAPGYLDLRTQIADRAGKLGVAEFSTSPWCSAHHTQTFFSHRRSGGADGRMVAYLGRPLTVP